MAEVKAEKNSMSMTMHKDILASESDAVMERGSPLYYSLTKAISELARPFLNPGSRVVDLFSNGGIWIEQLQKEAAFRCRFLSINSSEEEKDRCNDILRMGIHLGDVIEFNMDLDAEFPNAPSDLTLSILGLSKFDIVRRQQILNETFAHMQKSGALILVEKDGDNDGGRVDWASRIKTSGFRECRKFWGSDGISAWIALK